MRRTLWIFLPLFAVILTPTRAWEASVSQNLAISVTAATETVSFNPTSLTFASQSAGTSSPAQIVTMTNTGTVPFPVSSTGITGSNAGDFSQTNNCPNPLAVSASCRVNVVFAPTTTGTRTASVAVSASGGGTYSVPLTGAGAASPSGTTIPSASEIVDASGNGWTVSGGQIYRNGVVDPVTGNVTLLLYYNGTIYQKTGSGAWYQLNTTSWPAGSTGWTYLASGDPRTSSSGTTIPSAAAIVDASGNLWTVSGGQIYRNGVVDPVTGNVTLVLYYQGTIYQQTSSGAWYQLNTTNWPAGSNGWTYLSSGDPRTGSGSSCSGVGVTPASGIQNAVNGPGIGRTFCLAAGTYNESVSPKTGDIFWGAGAGQTILDGTHTIQFGFTGASTGANNVTIKKLTIRNYTGNGVDAREGTTSGWQILHTEVGPNDQRGITVNSGMLLQDSHIHHSGENSVHTVGTSGFTINNNEIDHGNTTCQNPFTATASVAGWKFTPGFNMTITNNKIHDQGNNGCAAFFGFGVWFDIFSSNYAIENNEFYGNLGAGMYLEINDSTTGCTNAENKIDGNYFHDNLNTGITLATSGCVNIFNNSFQNNGTSLWLWEENRGNCPGTPCLLSEVQTHNNFIAGVPFKGPNSGNNYVNGPVRIADNNQGGPSFGNWQSQNVTFSSNVYYIGCVSGDFGNQGSLLTPTQWRALSSAPDANSTFNCGTTTLPNGVGPRGGFNPNGTDGQGVP